MNETGLRIENSDAFQVTSSPNEYTKCEKRKCFVFNVHTIIQTSSWFIAFRNATHTINEMLKHIFF